LVFFSSPKQPKPSHTSRYVPLCCRCSRREKSPHLACWDAAPRILLWLSNGVRTGYGNKRQTARTSRHGKVMCGERNVRSVVPVTNRRHRLPSLSSMSPTAEKMKTQLRESRSPGRRKPSCAWPAGRACRQAEGRGCSGGAPCACARPRGQRRAAAGWACTRLPSGGVGARGCTRSGEDAAPARAGEAARRVPALDLRPRPTRF